MIPLETLTAAIRNVPDFPKPGIVFKDITPVLSDPILFKATIDHLCQSFEGATPDKVVGIDARGFIFGAAVALQLGCGFVPIRKKGKLPWKTFEKSYELEYGSDACEIHQDAVAPGTKILLIDDLLGTGGTATASLHLLNQLGAEIIGASFFIELSFLHGRERLAPYPVQSLLKF